MASRIKRHGPWVLAWGIASLLGGLWLARGELKQQRDAFETDARIVHRLLSQRVVQHDAVLATLTLLHSPPEQTRPEQRLPSVYPQILSVQRRDRGMPWLDSQLTTAETESRRLKHAVLSDVNLAKGRYQMVLGAEPTSYALLIDIRSMVPWSEWPMAPDASLVRVSLSYAGQTLPLQSGRSSQHGEPGWLFTFQKKLAAESQPFDVVAERHVGWVELPWTLMLSWSLAIALLLQVARTWLRQRHDRQRAEELLRLGQVARLNTLGELAAGMAHELNQPLTAVLANTQAASRLLADDPPELDPARQAMGQAVEQARRACDVIGRLRRSVEQPGIGAHARPQNLQDMVQKALYLLEPEIRRRHVNISQTASNGAFMVMAEPVALEQIIHNLLMNALQALDQVPVAGRSLSVHLGCTNKLGHLTLKDSGPGIAPEVLPRIFEPFFTTRKGGLGLGLSLCETLAHSMGGTLTAANCTPQGAEFCLSLPLAPLTGEPA